ncbi:MAG: 6-bladed beta-propeller [Bdellovibrionota bacterium]
MKAIKRYLTSGLVIAMSLVTINSGIAASDAKPVFFPGGDVPARIQFLGNIDGENFFNNGGSAYGNRFPDYVPTTSVKDANPFLRPTAVTSFKEEMFVCDMGKSQITILNFKTKQVSKIDYKFKAPVSITVDADGTRYVLDAGASKVLVFSAQNKFQRSFSSVEAWKPIDAAIVGELIYVIDGKKDQVLVFNKISGDFVKSFGQNGESTGEFDMPASIKSDKNGLLYISNTMNGRVDIFNGDGKFLGQYGTVPNTASGNFAHPQGIALDRENRIYVVDNSFENVQIFNDKKQFLMPFGVVGNTPGGLNMPHAIAIDYDNASYFSKIVAPGRSIEYIILVANQTGDHKISVFGFLKQ